MAVRSVFQPIVDLQERAVVGYEALARGTDGTPPAALFAAARDPTALLALDWACRRAAVEGALAHPGFRGDRHLFVNVEPEALAAPVPDDAAASWARAQDQLSVVLEVTERKLAERPAELLRAVAEARSRGWGVALDDVGADSETLALLPLVRPDVIKLDLRLIQGRPDAHLASVAAAVAIEQEQTGAVVLAEGVETEEHERTAFALGATLGQGWFYGRPGELPEVLPAAGPPLALLEPLPPPTAASPFALLARTGRQQVARKPLVLAMTEHLEAQALALGPGALIIGTFEHGRFFTPETARRYEEMAARSGFVGALGQGLSADPAPGVRGAAPLAPDDPIAGEWNVVIVGHHFAAVLSVVPVDPEDVPDEERRFRFVLTHDRDLAVQAARILMDRIDAVRFDRLLARAA